jgi:hypothetical protein
VSNEESIFIFNERQLTSMEGKLVSWCHLEGEYDVGEINIGEKK